MENKEITLEDLAGMIKRGFENMNKRFDRIDKILNRTTSKNHPN